nr:histidine kinase [Nocardia nova]
MQKIGSGRVLGVHLVVHLVATAIANTEAHAELTASRARIGVAADQARRRCERDLPDGAQQRLVSLGLALQTARTAAPPELDTLKTELSQIVRGLVDVSEDLRAISGRRCRHRVTRSSFTL